MATDREIEEAVARCVGIAVFYHNGVTTAKTRALMAAEFQAIAGRVKELGLSQKAMVECLLCPLEAELVARYGPGAGRGPNAEFLEAFEGLNMPRRDLRRHRSRRRAPRSGPAADLLGPPNELEADDPRRRCRAQATSLAIFARTSPISARA